MVEICNEDALPTISIIILNYNGKKYLRGCLDSLVNVYYPKDRLEIILVDNGSLDGSVEYVKDNYPWVKTVPLKVNYGFTGGNNLGAKFANGDYVVFLNNDVVVDTRWLIELVKVVMDNPTAIVTSKSLFMGRRDIIDHAGSKATSIGRSFCVNFGRKNDNLDSLPKFVVQPYGASMLVKKSVFEALGRFDEAYFTSLEDTDLGLRAWLYGYKVIYVPTSVFYHVGGGTGGWGSRISNMMVFHLTKNSYMNILKYYNLERVIQGVMLSLCYYAITAMVAIKEHRVGSVKSILHAHVWVIKNAGLIVRKRNDVKRNQRVASTFLFKPSFFAALPEMLNEFFVISKYYDTYINNT